jgi:RNA-binding protein NOB1
MVEDMVPSQVQVPVPTSSLTESEQKQQHNETDKSKMVTTTSQTEQTHRNDTVLLSKDGGTTTDTADTTYKYLVIDSGPLIKQTSVNDKLWKQANMYYTVPAVLQNEIRDAKTRDYVSMLPFTIHTQQPSPASIKLISDFARKTGDYQSLSHVDIQVLALLYDLEVLGCNGHIDHIRTTPKRTVGIGKVTSLAPSSKQAVTSVPASVGNGDSDSSAKTMTTTSSTDNEQYQEKIQPVQVDVLKTNKPTESPSLPISTDDKRSTESSKPKTWASLVSKDGSNSLDKISTSTSSIVKLDLATEEEKSSINFAKQNVTIPFGSMNIRGGPLEKNNETMTDGQFSDADNSIEDNHEINEDDYSVGTDDSNDVDDDEDQDSSNNDDEEEKANDDDSVERELMLDFPSLTAAATVPNDVETNPDEVRAFLSLTLEERNRVLEERKEKSLQPISKSGKLYNSFSKYKELMKPKPKSTSSEIENNIDDYDETVSATNKNDNIVNNDEQSERERSSRIVGGIGFSGQDDNVDDDGEGWITSTDVLTSLKVNGMLDPIRSGTMSKSLLSQKERNAGPPLCQRAACATTDFAMQNVILQMNLQLLSLDGIKVQKLKTWVTRCGACFKVYTSSEYKIGGRYASKRLFCNHCGSDMMQRIAASVDSKTGRLRLHLSKHYKHNLRGSKFSLPKPGSGNKYEGDLLLREDQLLTGAWNIKVKKISSVKAKAAAESIFGNDIATNVGCTTQQMSMDDIRVGFGRRNPNAVKGRERRGKKKKTTDKACGLRRY